MQNRMLSAFFAYAKNATELGCFAEFQIQRHNLLAKQGLWAFANRHFHATMHHDTKW
jgi:hypothetical protein